MKDINTTVIAGRLTRDAELSYTQSGTALCKIGLASNRSVKKCDQWEDEACFFDATLWGKRGEKIAQYLTKGQQVVIQGELRQERWEQEGAKRSKVTINVIEIQLVGGKKESQHQEYSPHRDQNYQNSKPKFEDDIPW